MPGRRTFLAVALLSALVAPAHAWPPRYSLPAQQDWDLLPVTTREGTYHAFAFDGHVHTSHSHDADHPTRDVIQLAHRVDLDALVITDHGSSHATLDLERDEGEAPITVVVGEEVGGSFGHAVVWNVPDRRGVYEAATESIEALGALVHAQGGVVVLAHPGWWIDGNVWDPRRWMQYDALRRGGISQQIDAIEIWSQVYHRPSRSLVDEWAALLERGIYVPIVGNSDFHRSPAHDLGVPRNVVLCPDEGSPGLAACLLDAVRTGRVYVTDGPTLALTVAGRTLGSVLHVIAGTPIVVHVEARAPDGGTLELRVGPEIAERIPLPPRELVARTTTIVVPDHDSAVRVEIARATPVAERAPFSLLSNPVVLDVTPWTDAWRGPDEVHVRAPDGFSRRDVERARRRVEMREARREQRRAERRRMREPR